MYIYDENERKKRWTSFVKLVIIILNGDPCPVSASSFIEQQYIYIHIREATGAKKSSREAFTSFFLFHVRFGIYPYRGDF